MTLTQVARSDHDPRGPPWDDLLLVYPFAGGRARADAGELALVNSTSTSGMRRGSWSPSARRVVAHYL